MADNIETALRADDVLPDYLPMRDEDGDLREEFVKAIARAIAAPDATFLRDIVGELHEADLGDLIEALEPDERVRLVELTGAYFDFSALN